MQFEMNTREMVGLSEMKPDSGVVRPSERTGDWLTDHVGFEVSLR